MLYIGKGIPILFLCVCLHRSLIDKTSFGPIKNSLETFGQNTTKLLLSQIVEYFFYIFAICKTLEATLNVPVSSRVPPVSLSLSLSLSLF